MPKMQGQVTGLETKTSPKGKTYYRVQVGGQWLSTWDAPEFADGDEISYNVVQNGPYKNLADATKVAGTSKPAGGGATQPPRSDGPRDNTSYQKPKSPEDEARIVRQNAFTSASSLVGSLIQAQGPKGNWDLRKAFDASVKLAEEIFKVNMHGYRAPGTAAPATSDEVPASKEAGADDLFKY